MGSPTLRAADPDGASEYVQNWVLLTRRAINSPGPDRGENHRLLARDARKSSKSIAFDRWRVSRWDGHANDQWRREKRLEKQAETTTAERSPSRPSVLTAVSAAYAAGSLSSPNVTLLELILSTRRGYFGVIDASHCGCERYGRKSLMKLRAFCSWSLIRAPERNTPRNPNSRAVLTRGSKSSGD
jgi:hypothetical protein